MSRDCWRPTSQSLLSWKAVGGGEVGGEPRPGWVMQSLAGRCVSYRHDFSLQLYSGSRQACGWIQLYIPFVFNNFVCQMVRFYIHCFLLRCTRRNNNVCFILSSSSLVPSGTKCFYWNVTDDFWPATTLTLTQRTTIDAEENAKSVQRCFYPAKHLNATLMCGCGHPGTASDLGSCWTSITFLRFDVSCMLIVGWAPFYFLKL